MNPRYLGRVAKGFEFRCRFFRVLFFVGENYNFSRGVLQEVCYYSEADASCATSNDVYLGGKR